MRLYDIVVAIIILAIVMLMVLTIPTFLMDVLLVVNIAVSVFILLTTFMIKDALEFSIFPTILLVVTLFRLTLNLSSTRLILGNNGDAGSVIRTFGTFVVGGNLVVGLIIFFIIVLIQFIVITKGAERVSEVTARFTLDAMPGKQMAIDADLNTGIIDEATARVRREKIQREADFYGAMDGASKFVKGDAVMGIIITLVNLVGGLIIGMVMTDMPVNQVIDVYLLATVGDGLVSQIPALLVSVAMGIVVTRATSEGSFGGDVFSQLFNQPYVMIMSGAVVIAMSLIPGLPTFPMLIIAAVLIGVGILSIRTGQQEEQKESMEMAEEVAKEKRKPENVATLLQVEPIELEFGYGIIPMVDTNLGGDLLERVVMIRRQCALDMGIIVPSIRLRDNVQLGTNEYVVKIKGVEVARGEVMADHFLALNAAGGEETIFGIETVDPAFGLPALWITKAEREKAELYGYTTIDPPSVIATHLTEVIKTYGHELMNRQQVQTLIDNLRHQQPALVDEVMKSFSLGDIQKVLVNLLRENVPIRDMGTIMETMADYGNITHDTELLTEYVRQGLRRTVSNRFIEGGSADVITLDPQLEQLIAERTKQTETGTYVSLEPSQVQTIFLNLQAIVERLMNQGKVPIVLTSPMVRRQFKRITEQVAPDLTVLSFNELEQNIELRSEGVVTL